MTRQGIRVRRHVSRPTGRAVTTVQHARPGTLWGVFLSKSGIPNVQQGIPLRNDCFPRENAGVPIKPKPDYNHLFAFPIVREGLPKGA